MTSKDDIFWEKMMRQAAAQTRDRMLEGLPSDAQMEGHTFSETFEKRMELLMRERRKPATSKLGFKKMVRMAASFVLVAALSFSCVLSVDAWRERLFEMVEQKHEEYSEISYRAKSSAGVLPADFRLEEYRPSYLPEGYLLTDQMINSSTNFCSFTNETEESISFQQAVNAKEGFGMGLSINTEGTELKPFDLNGDLAYQMSNMGSQFILWNDDVYNYMIITELPMDEAIKVAESVGPVWPDAYHPPKLSVETWSLPDDYTIAQAKANGDAILIGGKLEGVEQVDRLLKNAKAGKPDIIRIADFSGEEVVVKELYFDGYRFHFDNSNLPAHRSEGYRGEEICRETGADGVVRMYLKDQNGEEIEICSYQGT